MRLAAVFGPLSCALVLCAATVSSSFADFAPGCTLPFDAVKKHHPFDTKCPKHEGNATGALRKVANRAKNNFCATGTPVTVTDVTFKKLQAKAKQLQVPFGSDGAFPADRSVLENCYTTTDGATIGEGSVDRYVGFVVHVKHSDLGSGESCNCNQPDTASNDVHINLGKTRTLTTCSTFVAEMSPHFRPAAWNPKLLNQQNHPLRITGQLFFDSVHKPCTPGHPASPPRTSLWEIHPVYQCEVCRKAHLADCPIDDEDVWALLAPVVIHSRDVMNKHVAQAILPALLLVTSVGSCGDKPTSPKPQNHAPIINAITAFPRTISSGDSAVLICDAIDPDGNALLYDWITDGRLRVKGALPGHTFVFASPSNSQVVYFGTPSLLPDTVLIQCFARDDLGGSTVGYVGLILN